MLRFRLRIELLCHVAHCRVEQIFCGPDKSFCVNLVLGRNIHRIRVPTTLLIQAKQSVLDDGLYHALVSSRFEFLDRSVFPWCHIDDAGFGQSTSVNLNVVKCVPARLPGKAPVEFISKAVSVQVYHRDVLSGADADKVFVHVCKERLGSFRSSRVSHHDDPSDFALGKARFYGLSEPFHARFHSFVERRLGFLVCRPIDHVHPYEEYPLDVQTKELGVVPRSLHAEVFVVFRVPLRNKIGSQVLHKETKGFFSSRAIEPVVVSRRDKGRARSLGKQVRVVFVCRIGTQRIRNLLRIAEVNA
mmetsp:Transcript_255/g.511  ORF Transcript_255/g.511 Transcript_255/m.511 type:complete len:302 (-) Transcript_255:766-1671(-)